MTRDRRCRDVQECVPMHVLRLVGNACGAVGMFGLGLKITDRWGRTAAFVLASLSLVLFALELFA